MRLIERMQTFLVIIGLSAPATAHVTAAYLTSGRAQAIVAMVVGLISVVIGWLALARSKGKGRGGRAIAALVAGMIGVGLSALRLASSGAIGTGSGKLGAIVALLLGLVGAALGGLALARSRRAR